MIAKAYNSQNYRYGYGTQERVVEIDQNHYTAEYWEYDGLLGRRWNIDPVIKPWESPYACFYNNPILYNDPSGLTGEEPQTHEVKAGDTYGKISKKYNVSVEKLREWNKYEDTKIPIGATLIVSDPTQAAKQTKKEVDNCLNLKGTILRTDIRCHPNQINYEALGKVNGIIASTVVSLTPAGVYQDIITVTTGRDILAQEDVSGFERTAAIIPFITEIKQVKAALKALKSLALAYKCDVYAKKFMNGAGRLMVSAGATVTHKRIDLKNPNGLIGTATEQYGNTGFHEFIEVDFDGKTYIFDNMNHEGILKSDYIKQIEAVSGGQIIPGDILLSPTYTQPVK